MERLLHALDLAILGDWDSGKRVLEDADDPVVARLVALMTEEQRREKERADRIVLARHELGNALSVAQANVEGMVDGVLEPTPERLASIRDALQSCGAFLMDLRKEVPRGNERDELPAPFNICELLSHQAQLVSTVAQAKRVLVVSSVCEVSGPACIYVGDRAAVAQTVRDVLLTAVRLTPPGGEIRAGFAHPRGELLLSISEPPDGEAALPVAATFVHLLGTLGGQTRAVDYDGRSSFFITLPALAQEQR
ncbi:MAG TPA: hypothetical protein VFE17_04215 [Candidatus Baltobacteraceae bacterium]|jgi:signal transduction histidine kinase|nr:hypothetical protein [Candidatus Baltobacteraceae bacterium]